ncbi:MAG TPA: HDIG domain-containing protein [Candidatus Omnitrophota bacterium]|nr:HDIG domain-containing protein [Candidatus Omnitrophota bacterium]HRZ14884.1 HDIG domain-containing protein [Candidatus Omnitrophota bacterium]
MKKLLAKKPTPDTKFKRFLLTIQPFIGVSIGAVATCLVCVIMGINLLVGLCLVCIALYARFLYPKPDAYGVRMLHLLFLFVLVIATSYFICQERLPATALPLSAASLLAAILFNDLVATFLVTLAVAVAMTAVCGNNCNLGLMTLISGMVGGLLVKGVRRRHTVIRAGFIAGCVQAGLLWILNGFTVLNPREYALMVVNGLFYSVIVLGTLPMFEYLFKTATNISLLELADFNHPLLHRLMLEAPGTYHHSLIVGNLSEAACSVVGANSLLARIGAYYHDVGKLEKAEYFSENQVIDSNKHDDLSPTMSKMVIMNHIKDGVDLARKNKLNPRIVDFIQQHHGTSLVYYFYRRALEKLEDDKQVQEEGFRYPGPKPATKEIAVVMLADSVEAATRTLKSPNSDSIKELVHKLINNKFIDGQLDNCDLTLKDLERIATVFVHILSGIYHSRISYPEQKSGSS